MDHIESLMDESFSALITRMGNYEAKTNKLIEETNITISNVRNHAESQTNELNTKFEKNLKRLNNHGQHIEVVWKNI